MKEQLTAGIGKTQRTGGRLGRGVLAAPRHSGVEEAVATAPVITGNVLSFDGGKNRLFVASITAKKGVSSAAQLLDVCKQLDALLAGHSFQRSDIAKQDVFLRRESSRRQCHAALKDYHSHLLPATSFIMQPPADGEELALEVLAIQGEKVQIEKRSEHLTIVRDGDCRWAYVGGIEPAKGAKDTYAEAISCFSQLHEHLKKAGFHFNQVVRTWIYERHITAMEKSGPGAQRQRYQILNDARRQFFTSGNNGAPFLFSHNLPPASTGIGMVEGSFVMECLALDVPKGTIEITPLNNPEQIDAHAYSQEVLARGAAAIKAAPLFSRGMSIRKDYRMLLISGTASIKGQETICLDDPAGQTRTTLENIALVLGQAQATLRDVQQLRVYIRNSTSKKELAARIDAIKRVVETMLPNTPKLFLVADVCRDNLLVEIEALSFVKTSSPKRRGEKIQPPAKG